MQFFQPLPSASSSTPRSSSPSSRVVAKQQSKLWEATTSKFTAVRWNACSINTSSRNWAGRSWSRRYSNCKNSCNSMSFSRRIFCKRRTRRRRPPRFSSWRSNSNDWYNSCRSRRANTFSNRVWVFRVTILLQVGRKLVFVGWKFSEVCSVKEMTKLCHVLQVQFFKFQEDTGNHFNFKTLFPFLVGNGRAIRESKSN